MTPYSQLRFQPRIPLSQAVPLTAPLTLYIEPTNVCNFRCRCCPIGLDDYAERSSGRRYLTSVDRIRDGVRELGGVKVIQWYVLGEPLSNVRTPRFISEFNGLAERQVLTTNGSLLSGARAKELLNSGLDYLRVSVYGTDQADHEAETRNKSVTLDLIERNVANFCRLRGSYKKPHVYVKMLDAGEAKNEQFRRRFDPIADEVEVEARMNWNGSAEFGGGAPSGVKQACPFPFYTLVIHADLKVSPCCVDWDRRQIIGDLNEQTLQQIWDGEQMQRLRLSHLRRERHCLDGCSTCEYFRTNSPDDVDSLTPEAYASRLGVPLV